MHEVRVANKVQLLVLDAALHVAAGTVDALVQVTLPVWQVGHHEARVGAERGVLGLDDHAPRNVPGPRGVGHRTEQALFPAGSGVPLLSGGAQVRRQRPQGRSWLSPRCSAPAAVRTSAVCANDRSRCRRAARSGCRATVGAAPSPAARGSPSCAVPHRCRGGVDTPPAGANRRTRTAARSGSGRSSRGRSGLPAPRAAARRSHRSPGSETLRSTTLRLDQLVEQHLVQARRVGSTQARSWPNRRTCYVREHRSHTAAAARPGQRRNGEQPMRRRTGPAGPRKARPLPRSPPAASSTG